MTSVSPPAADASRQPTFPEGFEDDIVRIIRTEMIFQFEPNRRYLGASQRKIEEIRVIVSGATPSQAEGGPGREVNWFPDVAMFGQFWIFGIFLTNLLFLLTRGAQLGWSAGVLGLVIALLMFGYVNQNRLFKARSSLGRSGSPS